jgi:hypothetical protein
MRRPPAGEFLTRQLRRNPKPAAAFACHSERSEEPPHFAFVVALALAVVVVFGD